MQELLGKIAALDPDASLGIRVIACFDELIRGNVNSRALLSTAASLAGCPAGLAVTEPRRTMRMSHHGELLDDAPPPEVFAYALPDGASVWLERIGAPHPNDAIIVERLGLAVGVRLGMERHDLEPSRDLGTVVDPDRDPADRHAAAERLGLVTGRTFRIVAAPLFAVWASHPNGAGDVVNTPHGPIHIVVVDAGADRLDVRPSGAGIAAGVDDLDISFRTAMIALQLCDGDVEPFVDADRYTGVIELLAESPEPRTGPDVRRMADVMAHAWAKPTVDALLDAPSVRSAARLAGVHHSTMQSRLDCITELLAFDPMSGYGRIRLSVAYLQHRLATSRVLDLPAPTR
ncbi:helix-turn-helix domain-containing protein [Actinomycetes bacterium M1A6_2h]